MRKTRIVSLVLTALMVLTMIPFATPVLAADISTPGENSYLDIKFSKGSANTDVVDKCLSVTNREDMWAGAILRTSQRVEKGVEYIIQFDLKGEVITDDFRVYGSVGNVTGSIDNYNISKRDDFLGLPSQGWLYNGVDPTRGNKRVGNPVTGTDNWYRYEVTCVPLNPHDFQFALFGGWGVHQSDGGESNGDFWVDNVMLIEKATGTVLFTCDFNTPETTMEWVSCPSIKSTSTTPESTVVVETRADFNPAGEENPEKYVTITDRKLLASDIQDHACFCGIGLTTDYEMKAGEVYYIEYEIRTDDPHFISRFVSQVVSGVNNSGKYTLTYEGTSNKFPGGGFFVLDFPEVAGRTGWRRVRVQYNVTTDHTFNMGIVGGYKEKVYTSVPDGYYALADFAIDNFRIYKKDVTDPVVNIDFNTPETCGNYYFASQNASPSKNPSATLTLTSDPLPPTSCGAGVTFDTAVNVEAGKTYELSLGLKSNVANASFYLDIYSGDALVASANNVKITSGEAVAETDGWYMHKFTFTPTTAGILNFDLLGGEEFKSILVLDKGGSIYIDSLALRENGVEKALYTANISTYNDMAIHETFCDPENKIAVSTSFDPGKFVEIEFDAGVSGIIGILLLRRRAALVESGEADIYIPERPINRYIKISDRYDIWSGAVIQSNYDAKAGTKYEVKFDIKADDPLFDVRVGTVTASTADFANHKLYSFGMPLDMAGVPSENGPDWYTVTIPFTALEDHKFNFRIFGGYYWSSPIVANKTGYSSYDPFYIDNFELYEVGNSEPVISITFENPGDPEGFAPTIFNVPADKKEFVPTLTVVRNDGVDESGVNKDPVVPTEESKGYVAVTGRETFWAGIQLQSYTSVTAGKNYTVVVDLKTDGEGDDFRLSTITSDILADANLGTGAGMLFTNGRPIVGREGWYQFSFSYVPTKDHLLNLRIFGGYRAKGTDLEAGVSNGNFYVDNFRVYEEGVEEAILVYDFETDKYFEDWSGFVSNTTDVPAATVERIVVE